MPTYEYQCSNCGTVFEKFQSITAQPVRQCINCKSRKVRRLIGSGSGIIFKGSGFYSTDYRAKNAGSSPTNKSCENKSSTQELKKE